ncbi:MAG: hypothetical protein IJQ50_05915 [Clostridia bacterium]|nr:hypothetical protein [Clostridia bacterium]
MKDIANIDSNFAVGKTIEKDDIVFYDAEEEPFKIYGIFRENGRFCRMPEAVAKTVNEGVSILNTNTAGGRVRFRTNSSYVAISAKMGVLGKMPHFALTGSIGFDIYANNVYRGTYKPPFDIEDGYESVVELEDSTEKEITINFPLYSDVKKLFIGLSKDADINSAAPYRNRKPIVYYGSSITQGGCASRPGMAYQAIISRNLNLDYVNLGFSGSAKAEKNISEYIKNLPMSVFVYDYDHNAPSVEHLSNTHERMFKEIREQNPDLPIIILPRPKYCITEEEKIRLRIIQATYENAINSGDRNVYFIDNSMLMELCKNDGTVDNCHCTDLGFFSMADKVGKIIEKLLKT